MTTSIIGLLDSDPLAATLAEKSGFEKIPLDLHRFPDGEIKLRLPDALPEHVIILRTLNDPNEKLIELLGDPNLSLPLLNGGTAAILFCFACLYLATAGGGPLRAVG